MALTEVTTKRVAISKANAQIVIIASVAAFVTMFCLVASKGILSQTMYQSKLIKEKNATHNQLRDNLTAYDSLEKSYRAFDNASVNVIDGSRSGTGDRDGQNSKIILDALPGSYDFPALTSSIEKIVSNQGMSLSKITGIDDQANQEGKEASPTPQAVEMPFEFEVSKTNYDSATKLVDVLQHSIRPMHVDQLKLKEEDKGMTINVQAHTFYQPGMTVNVTKKVVK